MCSGCKPQLKRLLQDSIGGLGGAATLQRRARVLFASAKVRLLKSDISFDEQRRQPQGNKATESDQCIVKGTCARLRAILRVYAHWKRGGGLLLIFRPTAVCSNGGWGKTVLSGELLAYSSRDEPASCRLDAT
jgi:hypothetical protein